MLFIIFSQCHNDWSQIRYLFTCGSKMISWRYVKETITTTSSKSCIIFSITWDKSWIYLVKVYNSTCARNLWLSPTKTESKIIYEDNSALFNWKDYVDIQKIRSCKNLADLFTKSLLRKTFEQLVHKIGLRHLNDLSLHEGEK